MFLKGFPRIPEFIAVKPALSFYCLFAVATSGFGQTFFISVMGGEIRQAFDISHALYGALYSIATVCSALLILRVGGLADTWSLPRVTVLAVSILAAGCLVIGLSSGIFVLTLGFIFMRLGGQGFISHLGLTTAARYFSMHRGKAVAMASSGFPLAEAVLPGCAVFLMALLGWRAVWLAAAAVLVALILPLLIFLSRNTTSPSDDTAFGGKKVEDRNFTRKEVLHDPGFYLLMPAVLASPFIATAVLFHQAAIAQAQGWTMAVVATAFTGFAAGHLSALFAAGPLVDRYGAGRVLPAALIPIALSMTTVSVFTGNWVAYLYLILIGITQGFTSTAGGSIFAERYGVLHIGAIRSMVMSAMIAATAVAPVLIGFLIDMGIDISVLTIGMAACALFFALLALTVKKPVKKCNCLDE